MLEELTYFIKTPYKLTLKKINSGIKEKILDVLRVHLFCLTFSIISVILLIIVDAILKQTMDFSIYQSLKNNREILHNYYGKNWWILIVIVAPTAEELVFRLPLSKNKYGFITGLSCMFFYFTGDTITHLEDFTPLRIIFSLLFFLTFHFIKEETFQYLRKKYFNILCWVLIVFFSWLHISNFQPIHWNIIYLYPIYVLPQLFHGIGLSYLMVKYQNILWPILLHMLINGVAALLKAL